MSFKVLGTTSCLLILLFQLVGSSGIQAQPPRDTEKPPSVLPSLPDTDISKTENLPVADRVYIERIDIIDNTIFSPQELETITAPYTKRSLSFEDLEELRNRVNHYYLSKGYINSGVILPDQRVQAGRVVFKAIEGRITEIEIGKHGWLSPTYIRNRIALGIGPPLNLNGLRERLQLIDSNPLVRKINAQLKPGSISGEATLQVDVEDEKPFYTVLSFNNRYTPAVGSEVFELEIGHRNISGWGDSFSGQLGINEGIRNVSLKYSLPVTARDTLLDLFFNDGDAEVVEEPFDEIDVESEETHYGISLEHPFIYNTRNQLRLGLLLEKIEYESSLLDRPFSFSPGVVDGESSTTVLRFTQEWILRSSSQVSAISSAFSFGLDAFGADDVASYSDFFTWLGQFQWIRKLPDRFRGQLLFRANIQYANGPLLPYEKFTIGGMNSVRGYRKGELVRDRGAFVSLEYRHPLLSLRLPKISKSREDSLVQLVLFTDWGWGENIDLPTPDPSSIGSAGLGFRWHAAKSIFAEVYYGYAFEEIDHFNDDLQDNGFHFSFKWQPI